MLQLLYILLPWWKQCRWESGKALSWHFTSHFYMLLLILSRTIYPWTESTIKSSISGLSATPSISLSKQRWRFRLWVVYIYLPSYRSPLLVGHGITYPTRENPSPGLNCPSIHCPRSESHWWLCVVESHLKLGEAYYHPQYFTRIQLGHVSHYKYSKHLIPGRIKQFWKGGRRNIYCYRLEIHSAKFKLPQAQLNRAPSDESWWMANSNHDSNWPLLLINS